LREKSEEEEEEKGRRGKKKKRRREENVDRCGKDWVCLASSRTPPYPYGPRLA
jgi:hypothetical protein